MKKTSVRIMLIIVLASTPVVILYLHYYLKHKQASYNFNRNLIHPVFSLKVYDLKYNSYYLAGYDQDDLFLGNTTSPLRLLRIDSLLTDTQHLQIKVPKQDYNPKGNYNLQVYSNKFYLFNGVGRSVLLGATGIWKASADSIYTPYFSLTAPIGNSSIAFRTVSFKTGNNSLRKESKGSNRGMENLKVLEKQVDGLFCTDGILKYNEELKVLIYLYYYRNEALIIDTNLNLIKKLKTIDPIDSAKFEVSEIESGRSKTLSTPPLSVNANCFTRGSYLFVQSLLMAENEDVELFKNSTVIDVYELNSYRYKYSFYLPKIKRQFLKGFLFWKDDIYAISDHFLIRYSLNLTRFP